MTQTDTDRLAWDDLPVAPARIFRVWVDGSEQAWAEYAWSTLAEAGLTDVSDEVERTAVVVRLQEDVSYLLDADELYMAGNTDLTAGKQAAFAWVTEGLPG